MTDLAASKTLIDRYDLLLLDLDGVAYVGERAVPGAAAALEEVRRRGVAVCFVTNNASRTPQAVAELLGRVGIPAAAGEVLTSAQAAAELLAQRLPPSSAVLVVGTSALAREMATCGLTPVLSAAEGPVAVVQGYGPEVGWRQLAEAAVALNEGALWVVTNTDRSVPSERGPLPGNGALVAAVVTSTGRQPDVVVGKPYPALFSSAVRRHAAHRPLVIGDRLDTDIEGAVRAGYDSLLVLTGVASAAEALLAGSPARPSYLAADLSDLVTEYPIVSSGDGVTRCRDWSVSTDAGRLSLSGTGVPIDALRALAVATTSHRPAAAATVTAESKAAAQALERLGLVAASRSTVQGASE
jgi:HAD superfamily hydrolase (TIGR01450 family)